MGRIKKPGLARLGISKGVFFNGVFSSAGRRGLAGTGPSGRDWFKGRHLLRIPEHCGVVADFQVRLNKLYCNQNRGVIHLFQKLCCIQDIEKSFLLSLSENGLYVYRLSCSVVFNYGSVRGALKSKKSRER
jgi:hypothetical protein